MELLARIAQRSSVDHAKSLSLFEAQIIVDPMLIFFPTIPMTGSWKSQKKSLQDIHGNNDIEKAVSFSKSNDRLHKFIWEINPVFPDANVIFTLGI